MTFLIMDVLKLLSHCNLHLKAFTTSMRSLCFSVTWLISSWGRTSHRSKKYRLSLQRLVGFWPADPTLQVAVQSMPVRSRFLSHIEMLYSAFLRYCTVVGRLGTFIFSPSPYLMPLGFGNSHWIFMFSWQLATGITSIRICSCCNET